ncbi:MAG: ankyrin repeat domain-containing protein [Acidobacteriota bacterium]
MSGGLTTETSAYWGEVAEVRLDVVEEWADLDISYSLPSIEPLPASRAGTAPENLEVTATPGGTVDIRLVKHEEPHAEPAEAGMSKDDVLAELKDLGFRRFDANSFILAATTGKADVLKLFIAGGMPVDTESGGRTALMSAAMMGRVEAGKVLIDAGADVNRTDSTGSSSLALLVMKCDATELLQTFIDAGADLTVKLRGGVTLRKMAELGRCTENERVLKEAGAK